MTPRKPRGVTWRDARDSALSSDLGPSRLRPQRVLEARIGRDEPEDRRSAPTVPPPPPSETAAGLRERARKLSAMAEALHCEAVELAMMAQRLDPR